MDLTSTPTPTPVTTVTCDCEYEFGPCEMHGELMVMREGASLRTAHELTYLYITDALSLGAELSPVGAEIMADARAAFERLSDPCMSSWLDDDDFADDLRDLCNQVDADLPYWTTWDDGYRIVRPLPGCPLTDD